MLTAQIALERGIKNEAPINVPFAWLVLGQRVHDQVVVIRCVGWSAVLPPWNHHIEIEPLIERLLLAQSLAQRPRAETRHGTRALGLRSKQYLDRKSVV